MRLTTKSSTLVVQFDSASSLLHARFRWKYINVKNFDGKSRGRAILNIGILLTARYFSKVLNAHLSHSSSALISNCFFFFSLASFLSLIVRASSTAFQDLIHRLLSYLPKYVKLFHEWVNTKKARQLKVHLLNQVPFKRADEIGTT